jgi:hypothetical protein
MSGWSSVVDKISVVVISRNEGRELKRTVENFDDTRHGRMGEDADADAVEEHQREFAERGCVRSRLPP